MTLEALLESGIACGEELHLVQRKLSWKLCDESTVALKGIMKHSIEGVDWLLKCFLILGRYLSVDVTGSGGEVASNTLKWFSRD